jgi:leucyl aminopeptidase (aminopeptidase T)
LGAKVEVAIVVADGQIVVNLEEAAEQAYSVKLIFVEDAGRDQLGEFPFTNIFESVLLHESIINPLNESALIVYRVLKISSWVL